MSPLSPWPPRASQHSRARFALGALALVAAAWLAPGTASAQRCPERVGFPTARWPDRTAEVRALRPEAVAELERHAFTLTEEQDLARRGTRTDALLVVHQGALVFERYARGYTAESPHFVWSVTKSVTNTLTGIAVQRGALTLDTSVCDALAMSLPTAQHCEITVRALLEFSSGLDWTETYEGQSNQASSVLAMLYGVGHRDMAAFIASHPLRDRPGTTYMYSSGDSTLLAGIVERALRPVAGADYPWTELFDPLGITTATFEADLQGTPVGSSWFYAVPRDLAKLGFLWLNDGCWEGRRLLPEGWVAASTVANPPLRMRSYGRDDGDVQGRQFWLNRRVPEVGQTNLPWPDVPDDAYAARGHWGQSIAVVPSADLVVVRLGDDRESNPSFFNGMLQRALAVVR